MRAKRRGKSSLKVLVSRFEAEKAEGNIYFEWRRDSEGYVTVLFIADTRSVEYLNKYPDILLLDYIYKTNKFDILLLHVLSIDYYSNSFTVTLCFLDQEITENYIEAVQYLRALF